MVDASRATCTNVVNPLNERRVQNAKSFLQNLKGVVFYAIPHGGADFQAYIEKVEQQRVGRNWTGFMQNVGLLSRKIGELSTDFDDVITRNGVVVYIFEEGKEVKDQVSGTILRVWVIPINFCGKIIYVLPL